MLVWATSLQHPWLNVIMSVLTFAGNETFYLLVIPLIYWCVSKSAGFRLLYVVLFSLYVNVLIKAVYPAARPVGNPNIDSIFLESAREGSAYPNDSFPSGHAQGSAVFWGCLAVLLQKRILWVTAFVLIMLTSFSRLYAGLHWPTDVLAGIILGVVSVWIGMKAAKIMQNLSPFLQWGGAVFVPVGLAFLAPGPEGIKIAGVLLGGGIGYRLENRHINMRVANALWKKVIAYLIGIAGVIIIQAGLKSLFPVHDVFDFLRYTSMGIWVTWVAPWLFVKTGVSSTGRQADVSPSQQDMPM